MHNIQACLSQGYLWWFPLRVGRIEVIFPSRKLYSSDFVFQNECSQCLLTVEHILNSQGAKAGCWPHRSADLCGSCWVLGLLLALEHNQVFALFVAVHPTVCGQDTLVRKSFTSPASQNHTHALFLSHMPFLSSGARAPNISNELSILLTGSTLDLSLVTALIISLRIRSGILLPWVEKGVFFGPPTHTAHSKETSRCSQLLGLNLFSFRLNVFAPLLLNFSSPKDNCGKRKADKGLW